MNTFILRILTVSTLFLWLVGCGGPDYILSVSTEDQEGEQNIGGSINSSDDLIDCPEVCQNAYSSTDIATITLEAIANEGYKFVGFKESSQCLNQIGQIANNAKSGECLVSVIANTHITAVFESVCANPSQCNNNDIDGDGISNQLDDCPEDPLNECPAGDLDGDNIRNGDDACPRDPKNECDAGDLDNDGIPNGSDVCIDDNTNNCLANCAGDFDGDKLLNCDDDPCPEDRNNLCPENDADGDSIPDNIDNCPDIANPDQKDLDNDFKGFACDYNLDFKEVAYSETLANNTGGWTGASVVAVSPEYFPGLKAMQVGVGQTARINLESFANLRSNTTYVVVGYFSQLIGPPVEVGFTDFGRTETNTIKGGWTLCSAEPVEGYNLPACPEGAPDLVTKYGYTRFSFKFRTGTQHDIKLFIRNTGTTKAPCCFIPSYDGPTHIRNMTIGEFDD